MYNQLNNRLYNISILQTVSYVKGRRNFFFFFFFLMLCILMNNKDLIYLICYNPKQNFTELHTFHTKITPTVRTVITNTRQILPNTPRQPRILNHTYSSGYRRKRRVPQTQRAGSATTYEACTELTSELASPSTTHPSGWSVSNRRRYLSSDWSDCPQVRAAERRCPETG